MKYEQAVQALKENGMQKNGRNLWRGMRSRKFKEI